MFRDLPRYLPKLTGVLSLAAIFLCSAILLADETQEWPKEWTDTDIAFKEAMKVDLGHGVDGGHTQQGAIRAWENFLSIEGIAQEQRIHAIWRIASMCAYNFSTKRGEKPDFVRAEKLFREARDLIPGMICFETINAATQHASQPGSALEKAIRKAENYRWFRSLTTEMAKASALRISNHGHVIHEKFYRQSVVPSKLPKDIRSLEMPLEKKYELVEFMREEGEKNIVNQISEFLEWNNDGLARTVLLGGVAGVANPAHLEIWRNTKSRFADEKKESMEGTLLDIPSKDSYATSGRLHLKDIEDSLPAVIEENTRIASTGDLPKTHPSSPSSDEDKSSGISPLIPLVVPVALLVGCVYYVVRRRDGHGK